MDEQKISIEFNLSKVVDIDYLEENVINRLADLVIGKLHGGHVDSFHGMAVAAIENAVSERLEVEISDRLSRPIPQTDRFGEISGDPKSLNDMISEFADMALVAKVGCYGEPVRHGTSRGMHDKTLLDYVIQRYAMEGMTAEIRKVAKRVNAEMKEQVQNVVAAQIAKTFTK